MQSRRSPEVYEAELHLDRDSEPLRTCVCRPYISLSVPSPSLKTSESLSVKSSWYGLWVRVFVFPEALSLELSSSRARSTLSSSSSPNPICSSSSRASVVMAVLTSGSSEKARCGRCAAWSAWRDCRILARSLASSSFARAKVLRGRWVRMKEGGKRYTSASDYLL